MVVGPEVHLNTLLLQSHEKPLVGLGAGQPRCQRGSGSDLTWLVPLGLSLKQVKQSAPFHLNCLIYAISLQLEGLLFLSWKL